MCASDAIAESGRAFICWHKIFPQTLPGLRVAACILFLEGYEEIPGAFHFIASHTSASLGNESAFSYLCQLFFFLFTPLPSYHIHSSRLPISQLFSRLICDAIEERIPSPSPSRCVPKLNRTFHESPKLLQPSPVAAMTAAVTLREKVIL